MQPQPISPQPPQRLFLTRRDFVGRTFTTLATVSFVPSSVLGLKGATPPSEKLNLACIGVGGRGGDDVHELRGENIVALCDVDAAQGRKTFESYPNVKRYKDFRKMLDEIANKVDGVVVGTPDHTHAVAAIRAMKMGKHVYCEKPMAHSIYEVRAMMKTAREQNVITQLGNQGHSSDSIRRFYEWIHSGAIGTVREVHAMCSSNYSRIRDIPRLAERHTAPDTLDWDLWLGPAQQRDYNPVFLPGRWRGWMPFGTGVIGDWVCHVIDPVFWALDLDAPATIEADPGDYDPATQGITCPRASIVRYEFPARGNRPPVKISWYDGAQRPPRPEEFTPGEQFPNIGALVIGEKGKLVYGSHGAGGLKLIPESRMREYNEPEPTLPRSPGHHKEWARACKTGKPCGSSFDYGGRLTELALLGLIAIRMKGRRLQWDSVNMRFTNCPEANQYLRSPARAGWEV